MENMPNNNPIQQINSQIANQNENLSQKGQQFDAKKTKIIQNLIARLFKKKPQQNVSNSQPTNQKPTYQEMIQGG